jgi:hypothetical protein|tara:strand:- start:4 stop:228 length:225 start_codon:yes stop_codon:yes gene_type:complete
MLHPIEDNLDKYTNQELEAKYSELTKKFYMTRNPQVKNQMATLIEMYRLEIRTRHAKEMAKNQNKDLDNLINIS